MNNSIQQKFLDNGYVIIKDAIGTSSIDSCMSSLQAAKRRKTFLYYTQSTHRWVTPRLSAQGFLYDSILNPSQQVQAPRLASSVRDVIYQKSVSEALSYVFPAYLDFVSWQDMLFDRSTGTIDHIDSWYLDTEVEGGLVGIWFALEDIDERSGPFFVCPESHRHKPISKKEVPDHNVFLSKVQERIERFNLEKKPLLLKKGDIVIWSSLLIHGAFSCRDERYSRKSLTSHYYPLGSRRNDSLTRKALINDLQSIRKTSNPRIHRLSKPSRTPLFYCLGGPVLALKQKMGSFSSNSWNMRRD